MERRDFLRSILGVAAATALPSEVWPFRKIFLPTARILRAEELRDAFGDYMRQIDSMSFSDGMSVYYPGIVPMPPGMKIVNIEIPRWDELIDQKKMKVMLA